VTSGERRIGFGLACAALLCAAACGGSSSATSTGSGAQTGGSTSTPVGSTTTGSTMPDPNFDEGQLVIITATGFQPKWLVSIVNKPILWRDDTKHPQTVVFDAVGNTVRTIPPGGSYTYTPTTPISIAYHDGLHHAWHGVVQVSTTTPQ
jgi:hypothetical protein